MTQIGHRKWAGRGSGWIYHSPTSGSAALPTVKSNIGLGRCFIMSWRFPEMGAPLNHPKPSILGYPHFRKPPVVQRPIPFYRLFKVLSGMDLEREAARQNPTFCGISVWARLSLSRPCVWQNSVSLSTTGSHGAGHISGRISNLYL